MTKASINMNAQYVFILIYKVNLDYSDLPDEAIYQGNAQYKLILTDEIDKLHLLEIIQIKVYSVLDKRQHSALLLD